MQRRDFLRRTAYAAGRGRSRGLAPAEPAPRRGREARGAGRAASLPGEHADRPLRGADDGEPVVRPLLRVAAERRRGAGSAHTRTRTTGALRSPRGTPPRSGPPSGRAAGIPTPDHGVGRRPRAAGQRRAPTPEPRARRVPGRRQRRVRALLLRRGRPRLHPPAGREFTVYDRFHCSLLGPTWPNRYYKWSAQSGGKRDNTPPADTAGQPVGDGVRPRASRRGPARRATTTRTCRSRRSGARAACAWTRPVAEYYADCAAGTLPNITIVDPRSATAAAATASRPTSTRSATCGSARRSCPTWCTPSSSRPTGSAARCSSSTTSGAASSTTCARRACPTRARSSNIDNDFGQMGFRIPAVAVSPFAKRGAVSHQLCGFESIISLISLPVRARPPHHARRARPEHRRHAWTGRKPNFERPDLPDPDRIVSAPCTLGGGDILDGEQTHASDLAALEDLAERFGFPTGTGAADQIFRKPDSLQKALSLDLAIAPAIPRPDPSPLQKPLSPAILLISRELPGVFSFLPSGR